MSSVNGPAGDMQRLEGLSYLEFCTALKHFSRPPGQLEAGERHEVRRLALRAWDISARALASPEASQIRVDAAMVDARLDAIMARYPDRSGFERDLLVHGLRCECLREGIRRELVLEAVLDLVAQREVHVTMSDIRAFHARHRERFQRPETRTARQILITINPDLPDNARSQAGRRIALLRSRVVGTGIPGFARIARRHSECPSALEGGLLGTIPRGLLFGSLDDALFTLRPGEVSAVLETELGFHLLLCEAIHPAHVESLQEAEPRIREHLSSRLRHGAQRRWLEMLPARYVLDRERLP